MKRILKTLAMTVGFTVIGSGVLTAAECGQHDDVVKFLGNKYKEQRNAMGLVSNRSVMEFFVAEETGTWTVLLTNTQGISCVVAAGQAFEKSEPAAAAIGDQRL